MLSLIEISKYKRMLRQYEVFFCLYVAAMLVWLGVGVLGWSGPDLGVSLETRVLVLFCGYMVMAGLWIAFNCYMAGDLRYWRAVEKVVLYTKGAIVTVFGLGILGLFALVAGQGLSFLMPYYCVLGGMLVIIPIMGGASYQRVIAMPRKLRPGDGRKFLVSEERLKQKQKKHKEKALDIAVFKQDLSSALKYGPQSTKIYFEDFVMLRQNNILRRLVFEGSLKQLLLHVLETSRDWMNEIGFYFLSFVDNRPTLYDDLNIGVVEIAKQQGILQSMGLWKVTLRNSFLHVIAGLWEVAGGERK